MSLRHVLLCQLSTAPKSGYDLTVALDRSIRQFWHASHQQVYRELAKMTELGWVDFEVEQQPKKPDLKRYYVTQAGLEALSAWAGSEIPALKIKNEMLIRLLAMPQVGAAPVVASFEQELARVNALLSELSSMHSTYFKSVPPNGNPTQLAMYLSLQYGIEYWSMTARWLQQTIGLLSGPSH
ncbi:MAG: PadR family transcriptional regulator [Gammaproteobacteria bacterium]|nr:PadR family transcriptional regulator [Gammaproteobacteria bacterium]